MCSRGKRKGPLELLLDVLTVVSLAAPQMPCCSLGRGVWLENTLARRDVEKYQ